MHRLGQLVKIDEDIGVIEGFVTESERRTTILLHFPAREEKRVKDVKLNDLLFQKENIRDNKNENYIPNDNLIGKAVLNLNSKMEKGRIGHIVAEKKNNLVDIFFKASAEEIIICKVKNLHLLVNEMDKGRQLVLRQNEDGKKVLQLPLVPKRDLPLLSMGNFSLVSSDHNNKYHYEHCMLQKKIDAEEREEGNEEEKEKEEEEEKKEGDCQVKGAKNKEELQVAKSQQQKVEWTKQSQKQEDKEINHADVEDKDLVFSSKEKSRGKLEEKNFTPEIFEEEKEALQNKGESLQWLHNKVRLLIDGDVKDEEAKIFLGRIGTVTYQNLGFIKVSLDSLPRLEFEYEEIAKQKIALQGNYVSIFQSLSISQGHEMLILLLVWLVLPSIAKIILDVTKTFADIDIENGLTRLLQTSINHTNVTLPDDMYNVADEIFGFDLHNIKLQKDLIFRGLYFSCLYLYYRMTNKRDKR